MKVWYWVSSICGSWVLGITCLRYSAGKQERESRDSKMSVVCLSVLRVFAKWFCPHVEEEQNVLTPSGKCEEITLRFQS